MQIRPVTERRHLADEVAQQLIDLIVSRMLAPDAPLPGESELAERFGVSRTVIREAMRILVSHGMIRVRHGVGSFVNARRAWRVSQPLQLLIRSDTENLYHWLETRQVLETGTARLAALRATAEELRGLAHIVQVMQLQLVQLTDEFVELDQRFHLMLARATHNPSLEIMIEPILRPLRGRMRDSLRIPGTAEQAVNEHEAIVAALQARDPEAAATAMEAHLTRVREEIQQLPSVPASSSAEQGGLV